MSEKGGIHEWTATVAAGTYEYQYFVNNTWRIDEMHPTTTDPKGNVNNLMTVKTPQQLLLRL